MKKLTKQQAIDLHCKDCLYDEYDTGSWRKQTTQCEMKACTLYPYRPIDKAAMAEKRAVKLASMSNKERILYNKRVAAAKKNLGRQKGA